jgi:hypothetical protein
VPQAAPGEQKAIGAEVQRAVRKAVWRQSCLRAMVKRSIQLALIVALIYAALVGIGYAADRVAQIDPTGVIVSHLPKMPQLPDLSWLGRLVEYGKSIGGIAQTSKLVVTQPVNLRPDPSTQAAPLRRLPVGTVLEQLEGPVDDATGRPLKWLKVVVVDDGTQGWIAQQPDRLRQQ